ncbi:hypothetical protein [Rhodoplanes elegans]|uniref:hypothetical protein n=1 Tax=Rhodoplanes elegans TaxID=29408 RepID=UPI0011B937DC|nr:hypothetical protein [Rhodoplanes elegans]
MLYPNTQAPIYMGTADNAAQHSDPTAEKRLIFEVVVLSIMGFRTFLGTPFLWQSQPSLSVVTSYQAAFDDPSIGPSLTSRPGMQTADDYFREREADTSLPKALNLRPNSAFAAEQPGASALDWRSLIGPKIRVVPRYGSVETEFKALVLKDTEALRDRRSIRQVSAVGFSAPFSCRGRNLTDYHMLSLAERSYRGHFSRATIEDELVKSGLQVGSLNAALARTTALYQLANGLAHRASLFTSSTLFSVMPSQSELPVIHRWSVSPMNPYLFAEVLNTIGVKQSSWISISESKISQICTTYNPLRLFALYYREHLTDQLYQWQESTGLPTFWEAKRRLSWSLLRDNEWSILDPISKLPDRKYDSMIAGVAGVAVGAPFGADPMRSFSAARTVAQTGYSVIEALPFFDALRLRANLKRYVHEIGLI